jgi:hypothetical protein
MAMTNNEYFSIPYEGQIYNLKLEQVKELLKISEHNDTDVEIVIITHDGLSTVGTVQSFSGYNPLVPADVYIPINFKIKTNKEIKEISFLEVKAIEIKN